MVAHFHYVLIGGVVFPLIAGLYYWLPKITGRLLNERLGRWNFWIMFVFFNLTFFPMHLTGLLGMPRRIYTYPAGLGWELPNLISTLGSAGFAAGVLLFLVNVFWSFRRGARAGRDPWKSDTLEWSQSSPPSQAQFEMLPSVSSRHPMWDQDDLEPQPEHRTALRRQFQFRPADWRGALVVSVSQGEPRAVVHVPSSTPWPFVMSIGFLFVFLAALLESLLALGLGAALILIALTGWFRPQATERRALEQESRNGDPGRIPLVVGGPGSNGFWGTGVFVLVLLTALVTTVAGYFYLSGSPSGGTVAPGWREPAGILGGFLAGAAAYGGLIRGIRRRAARGSRAAILILVGTAGVITGTALLVPAFGAFGMLPRESAIGSAVVALLGFQGVLGIILVGMSLVALIWTLLRPGDPRGHGVIWNAALMAWFAALSAAVVLGCVYLGPRIG